MPEIMRRLHPRGAACRGICVDADGAMLGPECVLVERTATGFSALDRRVWARADIIAAQPVGGPMLIVEVKTGKKPRYTSPQEDVYPMAQIGGHVFSPYSKIEALGYRAGQWLPPMTFVTVYKQNAKSDPVW